MSVLIDSTLKVSLILACALAATLLLRRHTAAARHWLLAAAIGVAILAPALRPLAPSWSVQVAAPALLQERVRTVDPAKPAASAAEAKTQPATPATVAPASQPLQITGWLLSIWFAGSLSAVALLIAGFVRLAGVAASAARLTDQRWTAAAADVARTLGLTRSIALLSSDRADLLFTWGFAHPKVILPRSAQQWPDDRIRIVLLHEFAHIQRGDWVVQIVAELLRAAYWFNPLAWIAARRLRQESELACDDAVLRDGVDGREYAGHLLDLARAIVRERRRPFSGFPAPAMARRSSLERRFTAMLNHRANRASLSRTHRVATIAGALLLAILIAGFGAAQTFVSFSGAAFDPTNRALPGVNILLVNAQTQAKYEVRSDRTGRFEFVGLPPGDYSWEAWLAGFATLKGDVTVSSANVLRDLPLQVGSLEETLTVRGGESAEARLTTKAADLAQAAERVRALELEKECTPPVSTIGGQIRAPRMVAHARPVYPDYLNASKIDGVVVLKAVIGTDGNVRDVMVERAPHPDLGIAASDAVRQWQFTTTRLNCEPVEVNIKVTVNFVAE